MRLWLVFLGFVVVHGGVIGPEPQCSKFHYEEQLLEKMVRMEVKVEGVEKRIMETNQRVLDVLGNLQTERKDMKNEFNELQIQYSKEMDERIADIKKLKDRAICGLWYPFHPSVLGVNRNFMSSSGNLYSEKHMVVGANMNLGLVLLGFIVVHGASVGLEPQCSKFHYEEQLLEKMIRMEVKVEEMEKRISKTNQHVHQTLEELETEKRDLKNDYNGLQTRYSQEMEEHKAEIGKLKDTLLTETIAFKARAPVDKSLDTGQTILFTETIFNKGNGYDNMTGLFTVPVSGTYLFTIHLCIKYKMNMYYGIMVDNIVQTSGGFYDSNSHQCNTADAITVLEGGERVYVKCLYTSSGEVLIEYNSSTYNYWSTFSGLLIHK